MTGEWFEPRREKTCFCHSLISAFVVRCLDSMPQLAITEISRLASLCNSADRFESYLVENPEDRFSRDEAHVNMSLNSVMKH